MTTLNLIHMVIHSAELFALVILAIAVGRGRNLTSWSIKSRMDALELLVGDLEERHASLHASHKKLNSRIAMRQARAKHAEDEVDRNDFTRRDGESEIEWKRRCRAAIAAGALKHD